MGTGTAITWTSRSSARSALAMTTARAKAALEAREKSVGWRMRRSRLMDDALLWLRGTQSQEPDLLRGHRAALAHGIPHEEPAVAIHVNDAAYEGPVRAVDLDLAARQDIAPSPRLEDGSWPLLPVTTLPLVQGIEIVGRESIAVDFVPRGCSQRGCLRFRSQGEGEVVEPDVQVGTHTDDDVLDLRVTGRALDAGASHLASADQHIFGPFDGR